MHSYFLKSVFLGLLCASLMLVILTVIKHIDRVDRSERRVVNKTVAFFLWIVYGYMVLGITFLCREPVFGKQVSLIPFSSPIGNARLIAYQVENILMFIPYGVLMPVLLRACRKWYWCLITGVISSVIIEILQYMTMRGKAQIDDILLNSAGMMIGWLLFHIIYRIHKRGDTPAADSEQSDRSQDDGR